MPASSMRRILSATPRAESYPGPKRILNVSVYNRGALTLEALRRTVGDEAFREILREWVDRYRGANATTEDFVRLSESISGRDLDEFFERWLYQRKMPKLPEVLQAAVGRP